MFRSFLLCSAFVLFVFAEIYQPPQMEPDNVQLEKQVDEEKYLPADDGFVVNTGTRQAAACDVAKENISASYQQQIVDLHNNYRAAPAKAIGMFALRWHSELAQRAQAWANIVVKQSSLSHSYTSLCNGSSLGQNIWSACCGSFNISSAVISWNSENSSYTYSSNSCQTGKVCGHYTQVVWANSFYVGCGSASYNGKVVVVCNYYPPGNWAGSSPYSSGMKSVAACQTSVTAPPTPNWGVTLNSKGLCEFCSGGSSSCSCYACKNNGTLNAKTCGCTCKAGFKGALCEVSCSDTQPNWVCSQWYQYCNQTAYKTFMQNNCPCSCYNKVGIKSYTCCA